MRTGPVIIRWWLLVPGSHLAGADPGPGRGTWAGEFLVAFPDCGSRWLEIADVIVYPGRWEAEGDADGRRRLSSALTRFPGCGIVVTRAADGECLAGGPDGAATRLAGVPGMLCGCLAHGWLVAGLPLAALGSARLRTAGPPGWGTADGQLGAVSFSFAMVAEGPGPSAASRDVSVPALGAPSWS